MMSLFRGERLSLRKTTIIGVSLPWRPSISLWLKDFNVRMMVKIKPYITHYAHLLKNRPPERYKLPDSPLQSLSSTRSRSNTPNNSQWNSPCSPLSLLVSLPLPHQLPPEDPATLVSIAFLFTASIDRIPNSFLGTPLCCATTGDAQTSSAVKTAATLLGIDLTGITGLVGLTCDPITAMYVH